MRRDWKHNPPRFVPAPESKNYVWDAARRAWVLGLKPRHPEKFREGEVRMRGERPVFPPGVPLPIPKRSWEWAAGEKRGRVRARGESEARRLVLERRGLAPEVLSRVDEGHAAAPADWRVIEKRKKAEQLLKGLIQGPEGFVYLDEEEGVPYLRLSTPQRTDDPSLGPDRPGVIGWSQSWRLKKDRRLFFGRLPDGRVMYSIAIAPGHVEPVYGIRVKDPSVKGKKRTLWRWRHGSASSCPAVRAGRDGSWSVSGEDLSKVYVLTAVTFAGGPLFTRTSKMGCLSFNLPAGPGGMGGTCPAAAPIDMPGMPGRDSAEAKRAWLAILGQTEAVERTLPAGFSGNSLPVVQAKARPEVREELICSLCYALKGNYANMNQQAWALIRKGWVELALAADEAGRPLSGSDEERGRSSAFASLMTRAIERAIQHEGPRALADHRIDHRFFRIHDAGDVWRKDYLFAWAEVARRLPGISFWMPTRQWMMKGWLEALRRASAITPNLVIRPSALHFADPAPILPGIAAGSTASPDDVREHWPCPAMLSEAGSCIGALNAVAGRVEVRKPNWWESIPQDEHACRVCWGGHPHQPAGVKREMADMPVSYKEH